MTDNNKDKSQFINETKEANSNEIINTPLEKLAELEHNQWIYYSKDVAKRIKNASSLQDLQNETIPKWQNKWIDYHLLSEEDKDKDRIWAIKVLKILKEDRKIFNSI
jgi:hypothetical protein